MDSNSDDENSKSARRRDKEANVEMDSSYSDDKKKKGTKSSKNNS